MTSLMGELEKILLGVWVLELLGKKTLFGIERRSREAQKELIIKKY